MSLDYTDFKQIRTIVEEVVDPLEGQLTALNNDVKEIYEIVFDLQKQGRKVAHFEKYDLEQKIMKSYKNVLALAKEAGITLPS